MNHVYVFPLVGMVLGAILGAVSFIALQLFPASLAAVVVIVAIYWLCGINHIDGLADFADGVVAHGTKEKKIAAMKDVYLGTGGGLYMVVLILAAFAVLSSLPAGSCAPGSSHRRSQCQRGHDFICRFFQPPAEGFWADYDPEDGSGPIPPRTGHIRSHLLFRLGRSRPGGPGLGPAGRSLSGRSLEEELWRRERRWYRGD